MLVCWYKDIERIKMRQFRDEQTVTFEPEAAVQAVTAT